MEGVSASKMGDYNGRLALAKPRVSIQISVKHTICIAGKYLPKNRNGGDCFNWKCFVELTLVGRAPVLVKYLLR